MKRILVLLLTIFLLVAVTVVAYGKSDKATTVIRIDQMFCCVHENPCEDNQLSEINWTDVKMVLREVKHPEGHYHKIDTWTAKLSDNFGYVGHISWPWMVHVGATVKTLDNRPITAHLPGTGKTIRIHMLSHVTIVKGEPIVDFEIVDYTCVGKPDK